VRALTNPGFRRLWIAGLISDTGDWLLLAALPIVVYLYTGSTLGTAAAFLIELVPPILLAPVVGPVADRFDRRRVLVWVSLAQAAGLVPLLFVHSRDGLPVIYAVIALQSGLASLFDPTKNALLPTLVDSDELVSSNSLIGLNQNIGRLIGAPLGGFLLATVGGLAAIVAVDAVSFVAAAALISGLSGVRTPDARPGQPAPPVGSWRSALASRTIRGGLVVLFVSSIAQGLFVVLYVVFVARVLHGDSSAIGLLRGVQAIGAIGGGLLLAVVARVAPGRLTALAAIGFGLLDLAIWNAPMVTGALWLYIVLFILVGIPGVAMVTGLVSAMQQATQDGSRGRVFAMFGVAASLGQAIGMIAGGVLGDPLGVVAVLNVQGLLYILAGVLAGLWIRPGRGHPGPPAPRIPDAGEPAASQVQRAPRSSHLSPAREHPGS
jgi:MFS family permease